jgi:short-subunit dehydrogenase involved in D-alanine esterification of teichoic acids
MCSGRPSVLEKEHGNVVVAEPHRCVALVRLIAHRQPTIQQFFLRCDVAGRQSRGAMMIAIENEFKTVNASVRGADVRKGELLRMMIALEK